ncbi:Soluble epoxide hydrolase [Pandoraea pneumonica]|jgi:pimeloyl-ACP methyl ester carboxylesterase|uniref:Soluble epoxide hydrolase n=1 Tax=Pandoraea pneumonica TaxID=2508299 RepID=A0A5E4W1B6_9BURK|nr:alpha/beta hydrolase [Pandoraea pneumonica]VVE16935.1 Soluble epoxide hydrolase [Pandoraea pneumonica]
MTTNNSPDPRDNNIEIHHKLINIDGVRLHYVEAGAGAPILLIPGWPESWYAWRDVIPKLARAGRRVIAIDPRGMGDSAHPSQGFTPGVVAAEIHRFVQALGLTKDTRLDVASHDVGAWIAYAYAADFPDDVRTLSLFDAALPGISPMPGSEIPSDELNNRTWHFAFNRIPDLPEILVRGHEREYLAWLFSQKAARPWVFTPTVIDEYTRAYVQPGGTRTAFAYYRESFSQEALAANRARATRMLEMPVMALGGQFGVGSMLFDTMKRIAVNVQGHVLADCGHFVMEECPDEVAAHLIEFTANPVKTLH